MFVYNGKTFKEIPEIIPYGKSIKVSKEDILLTFVSQDIRSNGVMLCFSITYYNSPIDTNSFLFERLLDKKSLEKSLKESIGAQEGISIYKIYTRKVEIFFDFEKWLNKATANLNISSKKGVGIYYIKPNIKFPLVISDNLNPDVIQAICKKFMIMLSREQKFAKAFRGSFPRDMVFKQYKYLNFVNLTYDLYNNRFEVSIRNDMLQILYFNSSKRKF